MNEQTLMELVERIRGRFYGKYRGTVTEVDAKIGRASRPRCPPCSGDQETGWCLPCVPYAGDQAGIAFLPGGGRGRVDRVRGRRRLVPDLGRLLLAHRDEVPSRVAPEVKVIKTKGDQQIVLDDKNHTITITDSNKNSVTLDRNGITIVRGHGQARRSPTDKVSANDGAMEVT